MSAPVRPTAAPLLRVLRAEIALVVPRPRTAVTLATLLVIPLMAAYGLRTLDADGTVALSVLLVSTAEFTAPTLAVPVVLVAADAFAAERAHRTLDQLRLAPVGTGRLVALKAAGVLAVAALTALVTTTVSLVAGLAVLPSGEGGAGATLGHGALVGVWLAVQLAGLGMLLLPVSMVVRRTAAVVAAGLLLAVLGLLPSLPDWLTACVPSGHWSDSTTALGAVPVDRSTALATTARAVVYALLGTGLAAWLLDRRDG